MDDLNPTIDEEGQVRVTVQENDGRISLPVTIVETTPRLLNDVVLNVSATDREALAFTQTEQEYDYRLNDEEVTFLGESLQGALVSNLQLENVEFTIYDDILIETPEEFTLELSLANRQIGVSLVATIPQPILAC